MTIAAYLSHTATGRARIKIPSKRGDEGYFRKLASAMAARSDLDSVQANFRTGSLLLFHDGSLDLKAFARQAEEQGWFQLDSEPIARETLDELISSELSRLDNWLRRLSGGRMDNPSLIFLALGILAARQLAKGKIAPPAVTLLWYLHELLQHRSPRG